MSVGYSEEQITWLQNNYSKYDSYSDLTDDFNSYFNTNKSPCAIQQKMTKGLRLYLITDKTSLHYSKEEEKWIKCNYHKFDSYSDLTHEFNVIFGRNKTIRNLREKCSKQFKLSGIKSSTMFAKGHEQKQLPIGTIRKSKTGIYIKVKDNSLSYISGYREPYWLPIQKKIWMDHYGEVPDGKMIIFLDGNKENQNIDNLYCIDRKISVIMASNNWFTDSREHTLTAIKWCELYYSMKKHL